LRTAANPVRRESARQARVRVRNWPGRRCVEMEGVLGGSMVVIAWKQVVLNVAGG
jgi:hypothetical protein